MRPKSFAVLLLALGCGMVGLVGITQLIKRNAATDGASAASQSIFVANADIGMGDQLTSQVLRLEQWPKDKIPAGAITRIEDVEGRRTRTRLYAGEAILETKLLGKGGSSSGATALIPKGYRVVPVNVNLVTGGSSLILPGDRVDVMVHLVRDCNREIPETITRTILQDIKVFAVNDVVGLENEKDNSNRSIQAKTISLLVTPDQAAKLMLASQMGTVNLVMRSPEDDQQAPVAQARPGELFGTSAKSERSKESLTEQPVEENNLNDRAKGFLDFLAKTKAKPADPANELRSPATWTMRIVKPGTVDDVVFEAEDATSGGASPFGWRICAAAAKPSTVQPAADEATAAEPPPVKEPPAPAGPQLRKRVSAENSKQTGV